MKTNANLPKPTIILALAVILGQLLLSCQTNQKAMAPSSQNEAAQPVSPPTSSQPQQPPQPAESKVNQIAPAPMLPTTEAQRQKTNVASQEAVSGKDLNSQTLDLSEKKETDAEEYENIAENPFQLVNLNPLSTFSIDVDSASYTNIRRYINQGQLPPADAVRIEELINYFSYDYPQPKGDKPFSINTEVTVAPWNNNHQLVRIGLQGKKIATEDLPASNLVFLLDVSGSMESPDKLPLLKRAFRLLVNELGEKDRVSIVVYAGSAGLVLPPTSAKEKDKILDAIENLQAGGSTAGGEGIQLAYKIAKENLIKSGNNRVILASDGDFNVGISSDTELVNLIEQKRKEGIFLTVLGVGTGNLKDAKMEKLANKGNGNYAYIDNILEAKKVLVNEIGATLLTIAKDVKLQVEFNPAKVQAYRLIGYENRMLQAQDFNDDSKDAGELGAGHSVTALYEIIPVGAKVDVKLPTVDALKYQKPSGNTTAYGNNELMQVKLRYKPPQSDTSQLLTQPIVEQNIKFANASVDLKFASAVASFAMILKNSTYKGNSNFDQVLEIAKASQGTDLDGYRGEFIRLVETSKSIKK